ncbi:MAG: hypothetical protein QGH39_00315 [Candidatus Thermoplasmatota archaeon]|jgi:hypothetical protein|nr:hypothetical protein [Candidatus Thermoplasmatota archaeon]MDP7263985.1 hypothetical protein [Candidatus Thermoplasmatota archaeon]
MFAIWILIKTAFPLIIKNKRRTIISILGLAIGVAVLSAEIIAVDSIENNIMQYNLDQVDIDLIVSSDYSNITELTEELQSLDRIDRIEPVSVVPMNCQILKKSPLDDDVVHSIPYLQQFQNNNKSVLWNNITLLTGSSMVEVYGLIEYVNLSESISEPKIVVYTDQQEIIRSSEYLHNNYGSLSYNITLPIGNYTIECVPHIDDDQVYHQLKHNVILENSEPFRRH